MLNAKLESALNDQMNSELYSAHLYLSDGRPLRIG